MKKLLPILLVLCVFLCACNKEQAQTTQPTKPSPDVTQTEEPTNAPTEPAVDDAPQYEQQPMYAIALPVTEEGNESDGSSFTCQNVHLICQDQAVADRVILDFLNCQDAHRKTYEGEKGQHTVLYYPQRLDASVLSLYGEIVVRDARNHPVIKCQCMNYNMVTGEVLTLGSILKDSNAQEKLQDALLFVAETAADEKQLYDEYPQVIKERFTKNPSFDKDWFFTGTGISFFFEPYEIAPYASGVVILEIPYERLVGIISDGYFPAEEDLSEGTLLISDLEGTDLESYTQIAEVYLNGYRNGIFLYAEGIIRDVQIEVIDENSEAENNTIFAATTISPNDGIVLTYDLAESLPLLRIIYRSAQNTITQELYLSDDGTFVLT